MDVEEKIRLTAPCGLDCFNCPIFEANITGQMKAAMGAKFGRNPDEMACKGCRAQEGKIPIGGDCESYKCITAKGLMYCFECDEFPCGFLAPAREGADLYPHNFKLFNLCRMKAVGVERWAEEESASIRKRYYKGRFVPGTGPVLGDEE